MTRTDLTASSRPQAATAASKTPGRSRSRLTRALIAVPVALALLGPTAPALAASSTSGYSQTPPVTTPSNGTGPSTSSSPAKKATPSTATEPSSSSTLPFTGLDLRWIVGGGVLLLAAGLSLRMMQRREGSGLGR